MPVSSKFELYTNKWPFSLSALFPLYIFSPDACLHSCVSSFRQGNRPDPPKAFRSDLPTRHYQSLSAIIVRPGPIRIQYWRLLASLRVRHKRDCLVHKFQLWNFTAWNACASIPLSFLLPFLPSGLHTQSLRQPSVLLSFLFWLANRLILNQQPPTAVPATETRVHSFNSFLSIRRQIDSHCQDLSNDKPLQTLNYQSDLSFLSVRLIIPYHTVLVWYITFYNSQTIQSDSAFIISFR